MDSSQLTQYLAVLILAVVAVGLTAGMLIGSILLGQRGRRNRAKDTPWECGMIPKGAGAPRFSVKFYLVAMLFILFDIEVVFLYPWAVVYKELLQTHPTLIFAGMLSFLGVLFVGYIYALKKGAFAWNE
jgi:NADH-quinone oxidoreductase subunit A